MESMKYREAFMKKLLPLGISPLTCYPNYGSYFSIIDAYTKEYLKWIYNYFIQLVIPDNIELGFRLDFSTPRLMKSIPWLDVEKIDRKFVMDSWNSFTDFIQSAIDHDKYIFTLLDTSFTYRKINESGSHLLHEHLIYGYNNDKKIFYFADNYDKGKYSYGELDYSDVEKSNTSIFTNHLTDWYNGVMMLSYINVYDYGNRYFKSSHEHVYDPAYAKILIQDYLMQRETERRWVPPSVLHCENINSQKCWGIGIYDYMYRYLDSISGNIDKRGFYVLYEHKKILAGISNYIALNYQKKCSTTLPVVCEECVKEAKILLSLCLKYNLTHDEKTKKVLYSYIARIKKLDIQIMNELLSVIL